MVCLPPILLILSVLGGDVLAPGITKTIHDNLKPPDCFLTEATVSFYDSGLLDANPIGRIELRIELCHGRRHIKHVDASTGTPAVMFEMLEGDQRLCIEVRPDMPEKAAISGFLNAGRNAKRPWYHYTTHGAVVFGYIVWDNFTHLNEILSASEVSSVTNSGTEQIVAKGPYGVYTITLDRKSGSITEITATKQVGHYFSGKTVGEGVLEKVASVQCRLSNFDYVVPNGSTSSVVGAYDQLITRTTASGATDTLVLRYRSLTNLGGDGACSGFSKSLYAPIKNGEKVFVEDGEGGLEYAVEDARIVPSWDKSVVKRLFSFP